jgi:hypothetical protein
MGREAQRRKDKDTTGSKSTKWKLRETLTDTGRETRTERTSNWKKQERERGESQRNTKRDGYEKKKSETRNKTSGRETREGKGRLNEKDTKTIKIQKQYRLVYCLMSCLISTLYIICLATSRYKNNIVFYIVYMSCLLSIYCLYVLLRLYVLSSCHLPSCICMHNVAS